MNDAGLHPRKKLAQLARLAQTRLSGRSSTGEDLAGLEPGRRGRGRGEAEKRGDRGAPGEKRAGPETGMGRSVSGL